VIIALLAILVPVLCLVLIGSLCVFVIRKTGRLVFGKPSSLNYVARADLRKP
jgi:hypothetical protein